MGASRTTLRWDNASGKLSDERYATLSRSYEEEQKTLKAAVPELQSFLETETDKIESLQRFIQKVKRITELKVLTPELIHEFVDKIVVYAPRCLDGRIFCLSGLLCLSKHLMFYILDRKRASIIEKLAFFSV